jgi:predicted NBD/HSP70 family sugar kinase
MALGIDFGYERVRVVLARSTSEIVGQADERLDPSAPWSRQVDVAMMLVASVFERSGTRLEQVVGAGVGMHDPVDVTRGFVRTTGRSLSWAGVDVVSILRERLGVPVSVDNTSHLASLAEVVWGAGRGVHDAMYLKLAHGIGAGFLFNGRIFRGSIGAAGEIGHMSIDEDGPVCSCGNRGCLELYAGVPAVLRAVGETLGTDITLPEVLRAAEAGDRICRRVIADAGELIGRVAGAACNLLNLDRIIVGGDLAAAGDMLLDPLRLSLERHALPVASASVTVVRAALGDIAGALGGVALVFREADRLEAVDSTDHRAASVPLASHPLIDLPTTLTTQT